MASTDNLEVVQKYLQVLGIEPETTAVYLEVIKLGPSSALQVAKATKISRTQVYRHLEALQDKGLLSTEQLSYGTLFRGLPFENIEALITSREAEMITVKQNLGAMTALTQQLAGANGPKATVRHYYGLAGLKQINWNMTKAEDEYRVFTMGQSSQLLDKSFARRCRERHIERQLTSRTLINATNITASELEPYDPSRTFLRHVDPTVLTINFEVFIYDQVVASIDYANDQQVAIEIQYPSLSSIMKQLFDATWASAKPLDIQ